jgi:two-component system, NtrC family, response regulator PilR
MAEEWDVLVVDDEPVVREGIRRILEAAGMRVAVAPDAAAAASHPAAASCRLMLCDLMLPDHSGIQVLRSLRAARSDLPVVMITGYATTENHELALEAGATDFLAKPFEESELLAAVRRALGAEASSSGRKRE